MMDVCVGLKLVVMLGGAKYLGTCVCGWVRAGGGWGVFLPPSHVPPGIRGIVSGCASQSGWVRHRARVCRAKAVMCP
jgi:hypothetical protein